MIKAILFDLDGVLVDARELHYEALNMALALVGEQYVIDRARHLSTYDGLPTRRKLAMLTEQRDLPEDLHDQVWLDKQRMTLEIIDNFTYDERLREVLRQLKRDGYLIAVCSNSIRETVKMMLLRKGFLEYCEFYVSNQHVLNPKPNPEMFLRAMIRLGVAPVECVIVEDSHVGRLAALSSGASLCAVKDSSDVTYEKIRSTITQSNAKGAIRPPWQGGNMTVLIPMAGAGARFAQAGYTFPKPLVNVHGKPMIQAVVDNLNIEARHIFIVQQEHYDRYNFRHLLPLIAGGDYDIITVTGVTEGAACTTLLAKEYIDNDNPLLIANSDQIIEWDSNEFMYSMAADNIDGGIPTFEATHPKWSFAKLDEVGFVERVAEKDPISRNATVGIYYWSKGADYVKYAEQMIAKNLRVNNEFYVCPVYNEAIADGKSIKIFPVKTMWGLGTPEDLERYLRG